MAIVNLTINGIKIEARVGQTVLEAATEAGIYIPTLCHHPALEPIGACRICVVEVSKFQPLYPACTYKVSEGLAVETHSERVEKVRRFVLEMLFSERNHYCMYCPRSGNCELQDLGYRYGLDHWMYPTYVEPFAVDASRDTFLMDHNRCILCRRCVRACAELAANHTLGLRQRGARTMISADLGLPLGSSSCVECGTCLQVCPTGALIDKRSAFLDMGPAVRIEQVKSTCSQCSLGCGIEIVVRGGQVVRVEGDWDAEPNHGLLCKKGRFDPLYDGRKRITTPLIRRNGRLEVAGWDEAIELAAERLGATPAAKLGVLASSHATNEALYLANELFCRTLGVTNSRVLSPLPATRLAPEASLADVATSDVIVLTGADPVEEQPVVSFLIKRAVDKGARLVLVDDTENRLATFSHVSFPMAGLDQAIALAARADAPLVVYGSGVGRMGHHKLAALERARFLALQPGVNTRTAEALGLENGFEAASVEAVYVLLGEQAWDGKGLPTDGAFLVVQASYESSITEQADVVLPAAIWCEISGTLTNLEGRVHEINPAVEPRGEARLDWEILSLLARAMGQAPATWLDTLPALTPGAFHPRRIAHG
jgi:formate dehydrogenase major subunit